VEEREKWRQTPAPALARAAGRGDPAAAFVAGELAKYPAAAVKFFRVAAAAGYAPALWNLGAYYNRGMGVAVDTRAAAAFNLRAARLGHLQALYFVGRQLANGDAAAAGVARDPAAARRAFEALLANGDETARPYHLLAHYALQDLAAGRRVEELFIGGFGGGFF
jgi:TPR repeat protein